MPNWCCISFLFCFGDEQDGPDAWAYPVNVGTGMGLGTASTCLVLAAELGNVVSLWLNWFEHETKMSEIWSGWHRFGPKYSLNYGLPRWLSSKESTCRRRGFDPWVRRIRWRRKWQLTPVFLPGESWDRGAWQVTVHGVPKNCTRLSKE